MKISINIDSGFDQLNVIADSECNIFTANGQDVNANVNYFIFNVFNVILDWPTSLQSDDKTIKDGCNVTIYCETKQNQKTFNFVNEFPEDFYKLEILLDEVFNNVGKVLR